MVDATENPAERPRRGRVVRRWLLELAVLAGVYLSVTAYQERRLVHVNQPAPNFTLEALDGRLVSLDGMRGKRVLVHFWATWCGVCRREFGALNAVSGSLRDDEVLLSIVADADDRNRIARFVEEHDIRYPVLLGTDAVLRAFHVDTFPTNYYVDRTGSVAAHTIGMATRVSLASRLGCAK
jgi:peroxiredoxin